MEAMKETKLAKR